MIVALLQARNEQRYLRGWLQNIAPCVDAIVALDDGSTDATAEILRAHPKTIEVMQNPPDQPWNERDNHMRLIQAGRRRGADWFLCIDADERLESGFAEQVGHLLRQADADNIHVYSFQLRELWGDRRHYRCDGPWDVGTRYRMFRNDPTHRRFDPRPLHRYWIPFEIAANAESCGRHSGFNLYHLRMIRRADRIARQTRYETLDPQNVFDKIKYSYLTDETGLELRAVPPGRDFLPADDPAIAEDNAERVESAPASGEALT